MTVLPRTGIGVDVHAFADPAAGRELWLAGLHWPGQAGLAGHSDADVAAHAAADALLSAAGLGDLGSTLGTADPQWAGASGAALLAEAARLVREAGPSATELQGVAPSSAQSAGKAAASSLRSASP